VESEAALQVLNQDDKKTPGKRDRRMDDPNGDDRYGQQHDDLGKPIRLEPRRDIESCGMFGLKRPAGPERP
jgi:hypothetical protein